MNDKQIGEALHSLLTEHYDYLDVVEYEEHPFIIVLDGWRCVEKIVEQAKQIDPEISDLEDVILRAYDIDITLKFSSCYWGFGDEWTYCEDCRQAICLSPAHAFDVPDYWFIDGHGYACGDCIRDDEDVSEEYLAMLNRNHRNANTIFDEDQLGKLGFKRVDGDYYCRMFSHCDCPEAVLHEAKKEYSKETDIIFNIDSMNPFEVDYSLFVRVKA